MMKNVSISQTPVRGFTLLIAVVLTSVLVSVGLALFDITYKQVLLSSAARQSQDAFYMADSAMECALYWDQQQNAFGYDSTISSITCNGVSINVANSKTSTLKTSTFSIPCPGSGTQALVSIDKIKPGSSETCNTGKRSCLYSSGYNVCSATDPRRIERGLKVVY